MPTEAAAEKPKTETPPSRPVPDDVKLPEVAAADASPEPNGPSADVSGEAKTSIEQTKPPPQKTPEKPKEMVKNNDLANAKTLFSSTEDGSSLAQSAVDGLPRSKRVAVLCASELRAQLAYGSPSYQPYALPQYGLRAGTLLNIDDAAFGTAKGWYHVRFRCEVDADATKVVSFAHEVGGLIPVASMENTIFANSRRHLWSRPSRNKPRARNHLYRFPMAVMIMVDKGTMICRTRSSTSSSVRKKLSA